MKLPATVLCVTVLSSFCQGQTTRVGINPAGTWLNDPCGTVVDPFCSHDRTLTVLPLSAIGAHPGDRLHMVPVGFYVTSCDQPCSQASAGLFSSSSVINGNSCSDPHRVPGALSCDGPQWISPCILPARCDCACAPTDIPEDFIYSGPVVVSVPENATTLFLGTPDSYYPDNTVGCGSFFGVDITVDHCACRADLNCDGSANPDDVADFIRCYFDEIRTPGSCAQADFNQDGNVDPDDIADFIVTYFYACRR